MLNVNAGVDQQMGAVIEVDSESVPTLRVQVAGTDALQWVEVCNAMQVIHTTCVQAVPATSSRFKLLWQGAEVRGRGRQVDWDGGLTVEGNSITGFRVVNFHNPEKVCRQVAPNRLEWQSMTTGGGAGVILELDHPTHGRLAVHTPQGGWDCPLEDVDQTGVSVEVGGLDKRISICRLAVANGPRTVEFEFQPEWRQLRDGDNPLFIRVVQEDGHMAWSSPITLVKLVSQ